MEICLWGVCWAACSSAIPRAVGARTGRGWAEGGGPSCPSDRERSLPFGATPLGPGDLVCVSVLLACEADCPKSLLMRVGKSQTETQRASRAKSPEPDEALSPGGGLSGRCGGRRLSLGAGVGARPSG